MSAEKITLLRKLTTKSIMGARPKPPEEETFLYRVAGRVTGLRHGINTTDGKPWVGFTGNFQAQRADGKLFAAPQVFVVEPIQSMLADAIRRQEADGVVAVVEFGIDVFIQPDESSATGYVYHAQPVLNPAESQDSLLDALNKTHALPAPVTEGDEESEAEKPKAAAKKKAAARK